MSAPAVTSLCVVISVSTSPGLKAHRPAADGSRPATDCACQTMSNRSRSRHGPSCGPAGLPTPLHGGFLSVPAHEPGVGEGGRDIRVSRHDPDLMLLVPVHRIAL